MKETLEKVLKIEADCEELKKNSKLEAKQIKENAIALGKEGVRERKREANERAREIINDAEKNADSSISRAKLDINVERSGLAATADRNMKKASEFIVERIVKSL